MEIVIASKNTGKINEIKSFCTDLANIKWLTFKDFKDFPDINEEGNSFLENARIKARDISLYTGKIALADDSGLEVDFLEGRPGVRSSRYSGENSTDKQNRDRLLEEMKEVKELSRRTARFVCYMVLYDPEKGVLFETRGICEGFIGFKEKGSGGFGYDCIFIPSGYNKTMAQLTQAEKNNISHRGKALRAMYEFIVNF
ncbi:MAG: RdgB/HAM1 family non-canonical purine NTP pyrophosphatase [Actinomycetota bacterium]|nr:RdgB/HAM1 family non-canonical purine NTP pyrophosphatase [Actinomycetota bacterium]